MEHAVADKTVAVARHHADFAHALAQLKRGIKRSRRGLRTTDDFQQLHDVRRAEEMQAQHLSRASCRGGNGVDVQRRGIARQQRFGLQHAIEFAEDLLLELEVFVYRFDHQVDVANRHIVRCRTDTGNPRIGLGLVDPSLSHVVRVGIGHGCQRLFEHLWIVIDPLH